LAGISWAAVCSKTGGRAGVGTQEEEVAVLFVVVVGLVVGPVVGPVVGLVVGLLAVLLGLLRGPLALAVEPRRLT